MEKKEEPNKFHFKELFTNKQYRSIGILAFYAVLFIVLIAAVRAPNNVTTKNETGTTMSSLDGYELIDGKNFGYKYTVQLDEEVYVFDGKKNGKKELFTLSSGDSSRDYYINGEETYVKENDKYNSNFSKPVIIFDFFNTDILDQLIIRGILVDEEEQKYKIDNQGLYDVLSDNSFKVESGDNFVTLNYRNSYITGITLDLSSYSKLIGKNYDKVIISLEYFDFNLIDDFEEIIVD